MASLLDAFFYFAIPMIVIGAIIGKAFRSFGVDENTIYKTREGISFRDDLNKKLNKHLWVIGFVFLLIYGVLVYELYEYWGAHISNTIIFSILLLLPVSVAGLAFAAFYLVGHHLIAAFLRRKNGQK